MKLNTPYKIMLLTLFLIAIIPISAFANTLTLKVTTDKATYEMDDKVTVTVDWTEKMQAACYTIKYDAEKIQFESSNITDTFYNSEKLGEISINWASLEEIDFTNMTFTFKAIKAGEASVSIKEVQAFADSNLVKPTNYDISTSGTKTIMIEAKEGSELNPEEPSEPEGPGDNQITNNEDKNSEKQEDNSLATNPLPQAGIKTTIFIIIIIIVMGMLSVIFFIKNRKFSNI